jgi:hypothetical protein
MTLAVVEEDVLGVVLVEADKYPAGTSALGAQERSHLSIRFVRRCEHPECRGPLNGAAQQQTPQTSSAKCRPDEEPVDKVAPVEVARPNRHEADDRATLDGDEAGPASDKGLHVLGASETCGVDRHDVIEILNASCTNGHVPIIDLSPSVEARSLFSRLPTSAPRRSTHPVVPA